MGLFGGSDPLGGTSAGVEQVWVELRARTDKLKSDINGALTSVEGAMQQAADLGESGLGNSFLNIGTIAGISIAGIAVSAVMQLVNAIGQAIQAAAEFAINFVASGVQINASLQQMNIAFTTILGSTEAAAGFMTKLREEAAAFGGGTEILQAGKSLLPYAEGDIQKFEKLLTIAKQLAVIDPIQGFKGAGFALREALSGSVLSLANRFELPKSELNKLKKEFADTKDLDTFLAGLSELIGRFGATEESVKQMGDTSIASFNKIQFKITELQRFAGAPILAALTKHLDEFSKLFNENFTSLGQVAIHFGSIIAVLIDYIVETGRALFNILVKVGEFLSNLRATIADGIGQIAADIIGAYASIVNTFIDLANKALVALKLPTIKKIDIDKEGIKKQISDIVKVIMGDFSKVGDLGKGLDFSERVRKYEDMFKDLLNVSDQGWQDLNGSNEKGQEEDVTQFLEYVQKVRDILEKGNKDTEKEEQRHSDKMGELRDKEKEDEAQALEKFNEDKDKLIRETNTKIEETDAETAKKLENIEEDHAERIRQIRESADEQLFDAVNARDAKRVQQILNSAKKETRDANRERERRIGDVIQEGEEKKAQLEKEKQEKLLQLQDGYDKEVKQLRANLDKQLAEEEKSHNERMKEIAEGIKERLRLEARGWAESGKLTQEGLGKLMALLTKVFGPNGDYLELMKGFNEALKVETLKAATTLSEIPKTGGPGGERPDTDLYPNIQAIPTEELVKYNKQYADDKGFTGSFIEWLKAHDIIPAQFGFEGMVNKPTLFIAGEGGRPERVSISPTPNGSMGLSDKMSVDVMVRSDGSVSAEFESQVATKLSELLSQSITNRRTRRG